jgi:hypothetical protein
MKLSFAVRFSIVYLFIFLNYIPNLFTQETAEQKIDKLKSITNKAYGLDDLIVNGKMYRPLLTETKTHPYFLEDSWRLGTIKIQNDLFEELMLKYHLDLDQVIIRNVLPSNTFIQTQLYERFIDEFTIENHHFVKASKLTKESNIKGYVELVSLENPSFFIKHKKTYSNIRKSYEAGNQGAYFERKPLYFLVYNKKTYRLSNRKAFIKFFKKNERAVRQYFKRNEIDLSQASITELKLLIDFCKPFLIPHDE